MRCSTHDHMPSSAAVQRAARDSSRWSRIPTVSRVCLRTRSSSLARCEVAFDAGADLCAGAVPSYARSDRGRRLSAQPNCLDVERVGTHARHVGEIAPDGRRRLRVERMPEPIDGLLRRHPRRRHRQPAVAAVARRRPQVPARPHRLGADAAARHLGPPRAARRARPRSRSSPVARTARRSRSSCPASPTRTSFLESEPRDSAAAIGLAAAILRAPRARRHHRLVRRRPRHPRRRRCSTGRCGRRSPSRARATSARSASRRPSRPSASATSRRAASSSSPARPRRALVESFVEKPDLETAKRVPRRPVATCGTRACSSRAPTCCSTRSPRTSRELHAGLDGARRGVGRPRRARPGRRPRLADAHQDRDRLRRRRAGRREGPPRRHPRPLRLGRRRRLREPREAQLRTGASNDLAILGENARVLADAVERHRRQPDQPGHQPHRRAATSSSSTPRTRCWSPRASTPSGSRASSTRSSSPAAATCSDGPSRSRVGRAACAAPARVASL